MEDQDSALPDPVLQRPSRNDISRFLDIQSRELDFKFAELDLRAKEMDLAGIQATESLEAQREYSLAQAGCYKQDSRQRFWVTILSVVGVVFLFAYALYSGNKDVIVEIVKLVSVAVGGGGIGFYLGLRRGHSTSDDA